MFLLHFDFYILHFDFYILTLPPSSFYRIQILRIIFLF